MALDFLSDIGSYAGNALPGLNALSTIMQAVNAPKIYNQNMTAQMNPVPTAAETQANNLTAAALDPNSPQMEALTQGNQQSFMESFLPQLQAMQMMDRRSAAMGRGTTFFSPERMDEGLSYLTSRANAAGLPAAQNTARTTINDAANSYRGLIPAQTARQTGATGAANIYAANQLKGGVGTPINSLQTILQALQKFAPAGSAGNPITWNPVK